MIFFNITDLFYAKEKQQIGEVTQELRMTTTNQEFKDIISSTSSSNNNSGLNNSSGDLDSNILSNDSGHYHNSKGTNKVDEDDYIKISSNSDNGFSSFMDSLVLKIESDRQGGNLLKKESRLSSIPQHQRFSGKNETNAAGPSASKSTIKMVSDPRMQKDLMINIPYFNIRQPLTPQEVSDLETVLDLKRLIGIKLDLSDFVSYYLFASWESVGKLTHLSDSENIDGIVSLATSDEDVSLILVDSILVNVFYYHEKLERLQCFTMSVNPLFTLNLLKNELSLKQVIRQGYCLHSHGTQILDFNKEVYQFANLSGIQFMLFPQYPYKIHKIESTNSYIVNTKYSIDLVTSEIAKMNRDRLRSKSNSRHSSLSSAPYGGKFNDEFDNLIDTQTSFGMKSIFRGISSSFPEPEDSICLHIRVPNNQKKPTIDITVDPHWPISRLESHIIDKSREGLISNFWKYDCLVQGDIYLLDKDRSIKNYGITNDQTLERAIIVDFPQKEKARIQGARWPSNKMQIIMFLVLIVCLVELFIIYKLNLRPEIIYVEQLKTTASLKDYPCYLERLLHFIIKKLIA